MFFLIMLPFLFNGEVIAPHIQGKEIADINSINNHYIENRKFNDFISVYIPEISEHLNGLRSGWLSLWMPKNELGRPLYHISGFSPAYSISWIISKITNDPWKFITILSFFTCYVGGGFIILFSRESGLSPFSGFISGVSFATSPLFMYWITFPMFPSVWCWSAGVLWSITRLSKKFDFLGWSVLSFSCYSLLLTAYPQPIIYNAYIFFGYSLWLSFKNEKPYVFLFFLMSAVISSLVLALPVYMDLLSLWSESQRLSPSPNFFISSLPHITSLKDLVSFVILGIVPEIFGNPISPLYPISYDGISIPLIILFFSIISLFSSFKRNIYWWGVIFLLFLFSFCHPLYLFGVRFLGFGLSRSNPLGSIIIPMTIIATYGIENTLERKGRELRRIIFSSGALTLFAVIFGLIFGFICNINIDLLNVAILLIVSGLLIHYGIKRNRMILIISLLLTLGFTSYPLILRQDRENILVTSPLVENIKRSLPLHSRYAIVSSGVDYLPPNFNAILGISTIHSYNSLSSFRYSRLINSLGGYVKVYGRRNKYINPDYSSPNFWMSNIGLIISSEKILDDDLKLIDKEAGLFLYHVNSRMGQFSQVSLKESYELKSNNITITNIDNIQKFYSKEKLDKGDFKEFKVTATSKQTILILSQKYYRDWDAVGFGKNGEFRLKTIEVNGVFQGIIIPPFTDTIHFTFRPMARYSWIAHIFWLLLTLLLIFKQIKHKKILLWSGNGKQK